MPTATPPVEATPAHAALPTATASPTISIPTVPAGTPTLPLALSPPPLLHIEQGTLIRRAWHAAPQRLADLPDAGEVLAATVMDDVVFVLRKQGLQRVSLADGSSDPSLRSGQGLVLRFEVPGGAGQLKPTADRGRFCYSTTVTDKSSPDGKGTRIGLYQASEGKEQAVWYFRYDAQILGLTADSRGLYFLPRGKDSSFGRLLVAALETGMLSQVAAITEGSIWPSASGD